MTERTAPEIRQIPVKDVDTSVLPPDARVPGTEAFQTAVITHFASHYAGKGWNAPVTMEDEFSRIVAMPETGVGPKEYVLGLLQHGFLEDALPLSRIAVSSMQAHGEYRSELTHVIRQAGAYCTS